MKRFNVTGICHPDRHYMADTSGKIAQIIKMIERGDYFTINRARQYGKTTTINILDKKLPTLGYQVIRTSFEGTDDRNFESAENFCQGFLFLMKKFFDARGLEGGDVWQDPSVTTFDLLDKFLSRVCAGKRIVLMIDETDKSSNNLIFLRFVGMLRDKYLLRGIEGATFHSVILAGVYNIKNLKLKMIQAGTHQLQDGEKRINSPWNIAADFNIDMSLSVTEIISMLNDYENDHHTGMDIQKIATKIRSYTNGYPYLVSRICQYIDEGLDKNWTIEGIQEAVKNVLMERSVFFDDFIKNVRNNEELMDLLKRHILYGEEIHYNVDNPAIEIGLVFGIFAQSGNFAVIHNEIFELRLYNFFISLKETGKNEIPRTLSEYVIENNRFNMAYAIKKFCLHYYELYHESREKFLENECRLLFLTYLKPLINGNGFYHIETETRNRERMDVIVDFLDQQFIVEMKIWKGERSHAKAQEQLVEYLNSKGKTEGYLLTFDFRKRRAGKPSAKWVRKAKKKFYDCLAV